MLVSTKNSPILKVGALVWALYCNSSSMAMEEDKLADGFPQGGGKKSPQLEHPRQLTEEDVYYHIRSGLDSNYCLDWNQEENKAILWTCLRRGVTEKWFLDEDGYIRLESNNNKCLQPEGLPATDGSPIRVVDCQSNNILQRWSVSAATGQIRSKQDPNLCMDIEDGTVANGQPIIMGNCEEGWNQKWEFPVNPTTQWDSYLFEVAHIMINLGYESVDGTLEETYNSFFQGSLDEDQRDYLKRQTMEALSMADPAVIWDLIDPDNENMSPALKLWNDVGSNIVQEPSTTQRDAICHVLEHPEDLVPPNSNSPTSHVPQDLKDCMCDNIEPFVLCQAKLGTAAYNFHRQRMRRRQLSKESKKNVDVVDDDVNDIAVEDVHRREAAICSLEVNPPSALLAGTPSLSDLQSFLTNDPQDVSVVGSCCFDLQPPPLNLLEVCGSVDISIDDAFTWLDPERARDDINNGVIAFGDVNIQNSAANIKFGLALELCWAINGELEASGNEVISDILSFLGIDLCFLALTINQWPIHGHAQFEIALQSFIFYAKGGIRWQYGDYFKDTLGLCEGVEPTCYENYFCNMNEGETIGQIEVGLDFALWQVAVPFNVGHSPCDMWEDGTLCGLGTTCNNCQNPATFWPGKMFTACGVEPCWGDGTFCLAGTTCNQCCNGAYNGLGTTCGGQPWEDGALCGLGTTCNLCANPATYWVGKLFTACGVEPCWEDGTICLAGTTCNQCCNGAYDALGTTCGGQPWEDGTACGLGTTCNLCANPASYWLGKAFTACGEEPCWPDGTVCGAGTTCESHCCNTAYNALGTQCGGQPWADGAACGLGTTCNLCANPATYWLGKAFTACGTEPCWPDGTVCGAGTTCESHCCNAAYNALGTQCGGQAWGDGTHCGLGTTCNLCANPASYWPSKAFTACGSEPCWGRGTICGAGTTCNQCCSGYSWWWSKFFTACD